jgi:crossover junction endodeoxyribonuclease RuvC
VAVGVLTTPTSEPLPQRLASLDTELRALIAEFKPDAVAVERVFFQVNARTAMSVGQVSGLALAAAAQAGCDVAQYTPNEVKQAVAGYGAAPKEQVTRMVQALLNLPAPPRPPDAADALALALTHLAMAPLRARVQGRR